MGFFDRFSPRKPAPAPVPAKEASPAPDEQPAIPSAAVNIKARLTAAREKLEAKDLPAALAIYEEVLATSGDRADVLVTVSGDLGVHGHVNEIIELVAPRYDAERHGPATGLNLLQAYLAIRNADAAQHILDILFSLNRPELEERLYGFSNALAEMMAAHIHPTPAPEQAPAGVPKVGLITISKPIWFYGLEPLAEQILPPKEGRMRRLAFAQLALPGYARIEEAIEKPEDELARLSRAIPLWLAETFYFTGNYAPVAAVGTVTPPGAPARPMIFSAEWTTDNLRQLVDTSHDGVDYIITGSLRCTTGDYELMLRVYEVRGFRERKSFSARWTPATVDAELGKLHADVRRFMEWSPASAAFTYAPPTSPRAWVETLGASLGLFLAEKSIIPIELLRPLAADVAQAGGQAGSGEAASLAYLTLRARAAKLGAASPETAPLARSSLVQQAQQLLANPASK